MVPSKNSALQWRKSLALCSWPNKRKSCGEKLEWEWLDVGKKRTIQLAHAFHYNDSVVVRGVRVARGRDCAGRVSGSWPDPTELTAWYLLLTYSAVTRRGADHRESYPAHSVVVEIKISETGEWGYGQSCSA